MTNTSVVELYKQVYFTYSALRGAEHKVKLCKLLGVDSGPDYINLLKLKKLYDVAVEATKSIPQFDYPPVYDKVFG